MGPFADALWRQQPQQCELARHPHSDQQAVLCNDAGDAAAFISTQYLCEFELTNSCMHLDLPAKFAMCCQAGMTLPNLSFLLS